MNTPLEPPRPATAPAAPAAGQPFNMQAVLAALRCWWKICTPIGIVLAIGAGVAVFLLTKPTYTAKAWLIIKANRESLLDPVIREDAMKFIANQLELMRSPPIVDPVASDPVVVGTPEIAREPDPVQALNRQVRIRTLSKSDYFIIEFTSVDPKRAAYVANALANAYFDHQERDSNKRSEDLIGRMEDQLTAQASNLEILRNAWKQMSLESSGIDPFAIKPTEPAVQVQSPYAELEAELLRVKMDQFILNVDIEGVEEEIAKQAAIEPAESDIDRLVQRHPDVVVQRGLIDLLKPKLAAYRNTAANPASNKSLQRLESELNSAEAKLNELETNLRPKAKEEIIKTAVAALEAEHARLLRQKSANERMQMAYQENLDGKIEKQLQFRERTLEEEKARTSYEIHKRLYETMQARIYLMRLEQSAPARVEFLREAAVPAFPDEAAPYKKIAMAAIAALLLPFGLAIALEFAYRRVGSRDQLEHGGTITVVGEVTTLPRRIRRLAGDEKRDRDLQLFEESIDGLRTYLSLVQSLQGMRVLAVTSSISREGKTCLAAQLAVSIASSTREPTLLIDGDFRSPDIHRIFDVERAPGIVEVLSGEATLDEAIDTSFNARLHLLTAGQLDDSPHRLLGNGQFAGLIDKLRDKYRHIIIDTPPILAASEALVMARSADAAVLCVRRDFSRVSQVQEAYARLQGAGVKTAGAVLNGIPTRQYASRYGSYYYDRNRDQGEKPSTTSESSEASESSAV